MRTATLVFDIQWLISAWSVLVMGATDKLHLMLFDNRKILLGVTGGIAAYKAADLVRRLKERGADVQVVMTDGARQFITPLTLQAVSGREVRTGLFDLGAEAAMGHIELARWADDILIAPASADFLARFAVGMANDLLTTLCLATDRPIAVAPAMNRLMWSNPATQANITTLKSRGVDVFGPGEGEQACGETGAGRMLEPLELVDALLAKAQSQVANTAALKGKRVLITAGPTQEALDPVRYISNHSSGKMGYAIAEAAAAAGADVTVISGPVSIPTPVGATVIPVISALDMHSATMSVAKENDIFIATAAVADFRATSEADHKMKKRAGDEGMTIHLTKNPDILADVVKHHPHLFSVGFAAETQNVEDYARSKLERKGLNLIAANLVGQGKAFGTDDNALLVLGAERRTELPSQSKKCLANALLSIVAEDITQ